MLKSFEPIIHANETENFPVVDLHDFLNQFRKIGNSYCKEVRILVDKGRIKSSLEILEEIGREFSPDPHIIYYSPNVVSIRGSWFFISSWVPEYESDEYYDGYPPNSMMHLSGSEIEFKVYGDKNIIESIASKIEERIIRSEIPTLTWEYVRDGSRRRKSINLKKPKPIIDEFYPWIKMGVKKYQEKFLASESPILILLGEPGTGKTNFINDLIWNAKANATFTYEQKLFHSDEMFVDFIMGKKELLILEDADILLLSREKDANEVMNKFLNIGDGLVNLGKKKIIFTANITDKNKIDSALMRPGRCFDCMTFRKLYYGETLAACSAINIEPPAKDKDYSIAEIFGNIHGELRQYDVKFGF